MRLLSWNLNGLRARLKKEAGRFLAEAPYDRLCLHEVKSPEMSAAQLGLGSETFVDFNCAKRPGYSGVAELSPHLSNAFILPEIDLPRLRREALGHTRWSRSGSSSTLSA